MHRTVHRKLRDRLAIKINFNVVNITFNCMFELKSFKFYVHFDIYPTSVVLVHFNIFVNSWILRIITFSVDHYWSVMRVDQQFLFVKSVSKELNVKNLIPFVIVSNCANWLLDHAIFQSFCNKWQKPPRHLK